MHTIKRLLLAAVAVLILGGPAVASAGCDGFDNTVDYPAPSTFAVTYMGTCYVGYMYDPSEVDEYWAGVPDTCVRMAFPPAPPITGTYMWNLWDQIFLPYDSFWHSGYYYDQVLHPVAVHSTTVVIVNKTTFLRTSSDFDTRYKTQIKQDSAKAKWTNGDRGNYTFPATNAKAKHKTKIDDAGQDASNQHAAANNSASHASQATGTDNSNSGRINSQQTGQKGKSTQKSPTSQNTSRRSSSTTSRRH